MITVTLITLSVALAVFMRSLQEGSYARMIENAIGSYTGYVQVHQKDYWNDKSLDNGIEITDTLINRIKSVKDVEGINLRLESFSLASHGNSTKGTLIMGIVPEQDTMLNIKDKMEEGSYINRNDNSVVLGSKLASYLKLSVGDTLVLLGQGHYGQTAVGAYPVKGIAKIPAPDLDRQIVFMPLKTAQEYFSFPNGVTSIVVLFKDARETGTITDKLNSVLDTTRYRAMTWQQMTPEMVQMIESDRAGGIMMLAILYMIIAFGVFGTVLMMTEERKKEFAILIAIGTQKTKLTAISLYETIMMNFLGVLIGILITIPIVVYFMYNPLTLTGREAESFEKIGIEPIMPTMLSFKIFWHQILVILSISLVAFLYPLVTIMRLKIIRAMRR
jgi:ABC-type lipoprotein release transport system permease subunit